MSNTMPLHEALRPNCHPDQAGDVGQSLFALAQWLENNHPNAQLQTNAPPKDVKNLIFGLQPPIANHNHWSALLKIARQARMP